MELDVLRLTDALAMTDILLSACRREEDEIVETTKPASDVLQ